MLENALSSTPTPEAKDVARVWTLTVVRRIDAERKGIVLQFLHESKLLQRGSPIVNLTYADFSGADLEWAELGGTISVGLIAGADLSRANLHGADLPRHRPPPGKPRRRQSRRSGPCRGGPRRGELH